MVTVPSAREPEGRSTRTLYLCDAEEKGSYIKTEGERLRQLDDGTTVMQCTTIDPDSLYHLRHLLLYNTPDPDHRVSGVQTRPGIRSSALSWFWFVPVVFFGRNWAKRYDCANSEARETVGALSKTTTERGEACQIIST